MANYFGGDSDCVALWSFEAGNFLVDTIGGNDLTNNNAVENNTITYWEGAASARFTAGLSQYLSITDAALDAGFPLKNGDATKKLSVAFWTKLEALPASGNMDFVAKHNSGSNKRCLSIGYTTTGYIDIWWGYNSGNSSEQWTTTKQLTVGQVYHIGLSTDGIAKSMTVRVWDVTGATATTLTHTFSNELNVEDAVFTIGAKDGPGNYFTGLVDEVVVFKDVKTADDFDAIRNGTYGAGLVGASMAMPEITMDGVAGSAAMWGGSMAMPSITLASPCELIQSHIFDGSSLDVSGLTCSGFIGQSRTVGSTSIPLSTIQCSGSLDRKIHGTDMTMPSMSLTSYLAGRMEADMPEMECSGTLKRTALFSGAMSMQPIQIDAEIERVRQVSGSSMVLGGMTCSGSLAQSSSMTGSGTMPTVTLNATLVVATAVSRFTNYSLRYRRWENTTVSGDMDMPTVTCVGVLS